MEGRAKGDCKTIRQRQVSHYRLGVVTKFNSRMVHQARLLALKAQRCRAPRTRSRWSRAANPKISFHFFVRLPSDPPAARRKRKEGDFWLAPPLHYIVYGSLAYYAMEYYHINTCQEQYIKMSIKKSLNV